MLNKIISLTEEIYSWGMPEYFRETSHKLSNLGYIGAGNAIMSEYGLPIPPGATITIPVSERLKNGGQIALDEIMAKLRTQIALIEKATGKQLGGSVRPLLFAIRTSVADRNFINPPPIKYVGLNTLSAEAMISLSGEPDIFRRSLAEWRNEFSLATGITDQIEDPYLQIYYILRNLYMKATQPIAVHFKMMVFEQIGQGGAGIINTTKLLDEEAIPEGSYMPWRGETMELSSLVYDHGFIQNQIQDVVKKLMDSMIIPQNTDFIVEDGKLWIYGLCCINSVVN